MNSVEMIEIHDSWNGEPNYNPKSVKTEYKDNEYEESHPQLHSVLKRGYDE